MKEVGRRKETKKRQTTERKATLDARDMLYHFYEEVAVPSKYMWRDGLLLCMEHIPNEM
jgi:hypothetical protein